MEFELPAMRHDEKVSLQLRALFDANGYRLYRMGSFEEYDLYMQNKPFLTGEDIISFTGADGRLLALKPDVTLSIVKNTPSGETRKLYYNEHVFRRSRQSGEYREIRQMGLEFIGADGLSDEAEVLWMAVQALAATGTAVLDLSHMDFVEAVMALFPDEQMRDEARAALRSKSPHAMAEVARQAGLTGPLAQNLTELTSLSGPFEEALPEAYRFSQNISGAHEALDDLAALYSKLDITSLPVTVRLDMSILNDADYYNGITFRGYVNGVPEPVLSGGKYDNLLHRFGKKQGAVGFALYLDAVGRLQEADENGAADDKNWLNVALPKGRLGTKVYKLFQKVGLSNTDIDPESRKLVLEDAGSRVRYFLVKPSDVDTYVEHGAADIGVVGKDVLLENGSDVLELLDLGFGKCRLAVAGFPGYREELAKPLRVATKYVSVARRYFAGKSRSVEIINLHGSIELAPLTGLSDVIVDIVETGSTLKENNLEVLEEIAPSSARLVANKTAWRFKGNRIRDLAGKLGELL